MLANNEQKKSKFFNKKNLIIFLFFNFVYILGISTRIWFDVMAVNYWDEYTRSCVNDCRQKYSQDFKDDNPYIIHDDCERNCISNKFKKIDKIDMGYDMAASLPYLFFIDGIIIFICGVYCSFKLQKEIKGMLLFFLASAFLFIAYAFYQMLSSLLLPIAH